MICLPIMARTNTEAAQLLRVAAYEPAELVELRLDMLEEKPDIAMLLGAAKQPVLVTCRTKTQGGGFDGTLAERVEILQTAIDLGVDYVDAEEDAVSLLRRREGLITIASWHNFSAMPDDMDAVMRRLAALPCDWIKIAAMAKKQSDNLKALAAIARSPKPMISIAMGELGLPSRILGTAWGSKITFGGLAVGLESAPGQTTARDLYEIYRVNELTKQTAIYGLIGDPVNKSEGYRLHNRAFAATGLDAVYIPFQCSEADDVLGPLTGELPIRGLSVTMPHKRAALEWATLRSDSANAIGAANTLTLTEHGWRADNTDCDAVAEAVARHALIFNQQLSGQPALVLGIGGAARAVGVALQNLGCRVHIAGRCSERTADTAKEMGWDAAGWDETSTRPWRVVANATSLGMTPHENATPFPRENWKSGMIAFESVYHPRRTKFLQDAAEAGVATVEGMEMFIRQAARQFSIWTGAPLPESAASPYGIDIYPFVIEGVA